MRVSQRVCLVLAVAFSSCAKDDPDEPGIACTTILLAPIKVRVLSLQGLPIDSVTARNITVDECRPFPFPDAGAETTLSCNEQGAGTYRVRVQSGELSWTQSVDLEADECHVTDRAELDFFLDPDTAD
jgi:hypothetical protein